MDAILKALEARGYSAEVAKKDAACTKFIIRDQKVTVHLTEKIDRSEKHLTKAEREKPFVERWTYMPNGKLLFTIEERWSDSGRKRWADNLRKPLEDQLNEVMIGLISAAEGLRLKKIK